MNDDDNDEDGFGDFDDWQTGDQKKSSQEGEKVSDDNGFGDSFASNSEKEGSQEVAAPASIEQEVKKAPPQPFDAASLLAGFMADVGAGKKKERPGLDSANMILTSDAHGNDFDANPVGDAFDDAIEESTAAKDLPKSNSIKVSADIKRRTMDLIDRLFALESPIEIDSDEKIKNLLSDATKLEPLIAYLKVVNEIDEDKL